MEKQMIDHIIENLPQLIACTKDESTWYHHLLAHKFFSKSAWETIRNTHHNTESRIGAMYLHCTKTPNYDLLIQSLKDCDNDYAAKILEKYYETPSSASGSISQTNLIWFDIKCGTKHYKGRQKELDTIHSYWLEACREKSLTFVGITGLGGIGKSELATNYAHKFHTEVQGHCIWINAETNLSFSDSFHRLAKLLAVSLLDEFGKERNLESLTFSVFERLSDRKYLVVFDNLDSYEEHFLECFVQYTRKLAPSKMKPFVLLTSRCQLVKKDFGDLAMHIDLSVLSDSSAISFFKDALTVTSENENMVSNLKILCGQLGNFPLAMQQAVAYIIARSQYCDVATAVTDYSESFERKSKFFLQHNLPKHITLESTERTTYLTWQITLDKLKLMPDVGSKAKLALDVMSFFNAERMPESFLERLMNSCNGKESTQLINNGQGPVVSPSDETELGHVQKYVDVFKILADYSMCKINQIENDVFISVHRLVQVVSQINLQEEDGRLKLLNKLLQTVNYLLHAENTSFCQVTQIVSLLSHTKQHTKIVSDHQKYRDLLVRIEILYLKYGKYRDGLVHTSFATQQLEQLFGKENRNTLCMMTSHGNFLLQLGELKGARDLLEQVIQSQKKLSLKCSDIETQSVEKDLLNTKSVIASLFNAEGNYDEALKMNLELLEVLQRELGTEQYNTLTTKHNIASIYNSQGNNEEALKIFIEVLEVQQRVLGSENPSTLTTKHNIASTYNKLGNYEEALKIFFEVLQVQHRVLGTEHPNTLTTKHNIASTYNSKGNKEDALKIFIKLLEVQQRVLGAEHPNTLVTKQKIADVHESQGKYDDALKVYFEVLEVQERVLGTEHPSTLSTKYGVASMYDKRGNYEEALKLYLDIFISRPASIWNGTF